MPTLNAKDQATARVLLTMKQFARVIRSNTTSGAIILDRVCTNLYQGIQESDTDYLRIVDKQISIMEELISASSNLT